MIAFAVGMSLCCVWHEDIKKWIRIFDLNENPGQRILRTDIFVFSILIIISLYFGLIITKEIPREWKKQGTVEFTESQEVWVYYYVSLLTETSPSKKKICCHVPNLSLLFSTRTVTDDPRRLALICASLFPSI